MSEVYEMTVDEFYDEMLKLAPICSLLGIPMPSFPYFRHTPTGPIPIVIRGRSK